MSLAQRRRDIKGALQAQKNAQLIEPKNKTCVSVQVVGEHKWMAPISGVLSDGILYSATDAKVEISFILDNVKEVVDLDLVGGDKMSFGGKRIILEQGGIIHILVKSGSEPILGSFVFTVM